jgi:hypothetical protein
MAELTPDTLVSLYCTAGPDGDVGPLQGLDEIDWSAVKGAYGPATEVPAYLRALMSADPDHREFASRLLHQTVWHQGDVYSATPVAVPFLYNLLKADGPYDKRFVALLLLNIRDGHPPYSTRCEGDSEWATKWRAIFVKSGVDLESEFEKERQYMAELRKRLDERAYLLEPYLRKEQSDDAAE